MPTLSFFSKNLSLKILLLHLLTRVEILPSPDYYMRNSVNLAMKTVSSSVFRQSGNRIFRSLTLDSANI